MKRILTVILSFMLVLPLMAQTSIDRLITEIESKGVDGTFIVKRSPVNKKIVSKTRCYDFISKNGIYAQKFIQAFKESSDNAVNYVESKNNCVETFVSGSTVTTYILSIENKESRNPRVSLVITSKETNYRSEIFVPDSGWSLQLTPEQEEKLEEDLSNLEDQLAEVVKKK